MLKFILVSLFLAIRFTPAYSQEVIPLYTGSIPNHKESNEIESEKQGDVLWIKNVQEPSLEIYLPAKQNATGRGVVICPGGGYQGLAYDWEGSDIAKWLNSKGIAAFVLKYRLPKSKSVVVGCKAPLQDAQRAMRLVRHNAKEWNLSPDQIGIMGFSAGGHLASTLGTHFNDDENLSQESIDTISTRPDFMVLIYPVITMDSLYTHKGSRNNLIGKKADENKINFYSNELHVNNETPPTFIVHATDDKAVSVMNSILFYQALIKEGIHSEMHIYAKGGHGFGLALKKGSLQTWPERLYEWFAGL